MTNVGCVKGCESLDVGIPFLKVERLRVAFRERVVGIAASGRWIVSTCIQNHHYLSNTRLDYPLAHFFHINGSVFQQANVTAHLCIRGQKIGLSFALDSMAGEGYQKQSIF